MEVAQKVKSQRIFTHMWCAEEAVKLYTSIFPDSQVFRVVTLPNESPSGPAGSVKVIDFTLFGQRFQAFSVPQSQLNQSNNTPMSLVVLCKDQQELDCYWNRLLEAGGKALGCGWIEDSFGVRWQIVPAILEDLMSSTDVARVKRVSEAMLKMVKLDIAELQCAFDGSN